MNQTEILKQYFGYETFREGQALLVDSILQGKDVIGIMPTGAGKSICFQVPALLLPGITLVISPLISLMKDQVTSLCQAGAPAAYLNGSLSFGQYRKALANMANGQYKIIYVAPERLLNEEFLEAVLRLPISLLAVDEAHCISQWGQDFRPSYTQIPQFIARLPMRPVLAAFTATATDKVKIDIIHQLQLQDYTEQVTGFDRKNLYFEVQQPRDKKAALLKILQKHTGQNGIVYCSTRKAVDEICAFLCEHQFTATRYHAGLSAEERRQNQEAFLFDACNIIVATSAFGMGIDKSDVRFVVHYNMPMDLESYYQEAGRAGRDGLASDCILLYSGRDVMTNRFLIEKGNEAAAVEDADEKDRLLQRGYDRLRQMTFYSTTPRCLRHEILQYFGEDAPNNCQNCGNCNTGAEVDITLDAQKILSCVKRTEERFGSKAIVRILHGETSEQIERWHLDTSISFGILRDKPEATVQAEVQSLITQGYLVVMTGDYPVLALGADADRVLLAGEKVTMKVARKKPVGAAKESASRKTSAAQNQMPLSAEETELFAVLRALRLQLAKRQGLPAFAVFTDATLQDMCRKKPTSIAEIDKVSGVGTQKSRTYGEEFTAAIRQYLETQT
ncbi:MAG: DNA helicase RecQ [Ruthenibacterium sp.]